MLGSRLLKVRLLSPFLLRTAVPPIGDAEGRKVVALRRLGKRIVLDQAVMRIGRGTDNQIVLDGDSVSRRHAHFERRNDAWYAVDDGSTNGTYVNERQIPEGVRLQNNDRIQVGPTIFKYLTGADAEVCPSTSVASAVSVCAPLANARVSQASA